MPKCTKCTYCTTAAVAPDIIVPPLCTRHYEICLLISRAQRYSLEITVETLTELMERATAHKWAITAADIEQLITEVL